jgi:hypothetical protein
MLIIFKKKLISINKCNFKFTNIETVRIINIGNEIVDKNSIISIESGFQTSLMETYDSCMVWKV